MESGPASLAKSLPPKSMNPTCSVEGTTIPKSSKIYSTCPEHSQVQHNSSKKFSEMQTSTSSDWKLTKTHYKPIKSRKQCHQCGKEVVSESNSSTTDASEELEDTTDDSSSSSTASSISIADSDSFQKILDNYNVNLQKKKPKKIKKRNKKTGNKRKKSLNDRKKDHRPLTKRLKLNEEIHEPAERDTVAELIVLAMYLRYLESKRYSSDNIT